MTTTEDDFLNGRLRVRQPVNGYRAGADPVFLAAAVPAKPGDAVLELGCGSGVAMMCLLARVPEVEVIGVERQADSAEMARANLTANGLNADVVVGDVAALPDDVRNRSFDHVMMNPPFFDRAHGSAAESPAREVGRGMETDLSTWIDTAIRRIAPKGTITLIHRAECLPTCLASMDGRVGGIVAKPLIPRHNKPAKLFILQGKKEAKTPFRMAAPLVLHSGDRHEKDGESYTELAQDILRKGAAFLLLD